MVRFGAGGAGGGLPATLRPAGAGGAVFPLRAVKAGGCCRAIPARGGCGSLASPVLLAALAAPGWFAPEELWIPRSRRLPREGITRAAAAVPLAYGGTPGRLRRGGRRAPPPSRSTDAALMAARIPLACEIGFFAGAPGGQR